MAGGASRRSSEWDPEAADSELIASRARLFSAVAAARAALTPAAGPRDSPPEVLHELHRNLRKIRVELRPWRAALRGSRRRVLRVADRDLRDIARLVGQVRDRDVARDVLDRLARRHALLGLRGLTEVQRCLARDARVGRRLLPSAMGAVTDGGALEAIGTVVGADPSEEERHRWAGFVRRSEEEILSEVRHRFARARGGRSAARLHQLRQALRTAHLWAESYTLPTVPWFPESLSHLQSELGGLHDLWVTRGLLLDLPGSQRADTWVGPIGARFEGRCRAIRKLLDAEPTVVAIQRLVGDLPDAAEWRAVAPPELVVRSRNGAWT